MSQPLIIGAVSLAVIDTAISDLQSTSVKGPSFKIVLGGFITMIVLLVVADSHEDIADGMALLIVLATLVGPKGGAVSKLVTKLSTQGYTPPGSDPLIGATVQYIPNAPAGGGAPVVVVSNPNAKYNLDPTKRG